MKKISLFLIALAILLVACKPEIEKPTVVTKSVGEVTKTSAKVVGQVAAAGGAEVTERGVCWSTDGTPTILDFRVKDTEGGLGSYEILFKDLVPNTQYYVRAYATNEAGTGYGEEKTFTTLEVTPEQPGDEPEEPEQPEEVAPVVKTAEVTDIKLFSAVCGGEVVSNGESVVVARGVCWSIEQNPTIEDSHTTDGVSTGIYVSNLTELNRGTTYYVRAYAINANGITAYGEEKSFTTLDKLLPTVTTTEVTGITCLTAVSGGEVTFDGNVEVTARGICWSTSRNPTIYDNKTIDGSGTGSYNSNLTQLSENTTYYVRAYASNEKGTSYGEERTFTTLEFSNQTFTVNGVSFTMIAVEGGTFQMGATSEQGSDAYDSEKPVHSVTLSDYYIGETEVTQELWTAVMGNNPSYYKGNNKPVEQVSWNDCQEFVKKLNQLTGKNFRLPTEAEWEYAARGGNKSQGYKYSGSNTLGDVAWYYDNSSSQTHEVKTKQANELGIYDMSGNVWEWCQDWYGSYSSSSQTDPTGPSSGSYRVNRGGGWTGSAKYCRVSDRSSSISDDRHNFLGLRLCLSQY